MGIATTRTEERIACSLGEGSSAPAQFEDSQALDHGGVLFIVPSLIAQGLLRIQDVYRWSKEYYYSLESIALTLAIMSLLRIKNPEQLKHYKPGEIGRIIGLDRVPEMKCLRKKIDCICSQQQARHLNTLLVQDWYNGDTSKDAEFLYIDGHVRVYYGEKATLPVKYISRQKLCLNATTEFWVNDATGMPMLVVMGELNEKLQEVIEQRIIPQLKEAGLLRAPTPEDTAPLCTLVFDREAYSPAFFHRLWILYRIAVITYRKYVRETWPNECFIRTIVPVLVHTIPMHLCEQQTVLGGHTFREIRRRSEDGHQTSIITTHPTLPIASIAGRMFGRWSQENFFRYMIQDYDFDKLVSFGIESVDPDRSIVNPAYRKINQELQKVRNILQRLEAKFYPLVQLALEQPLEMLPAITLKQAEMKTEIESYRMQKEMLLEKRTHIPKRITISEMPDQTRFNKLKTESKLFMNVIRMICYRAESAVAECIAPFVVRADDEKRTVVKLIMQSSADLTVDEQNNTLTVTLHSLSAHRFNSAAQELTHLLNQTETIFPGTKLRMIFKTTALSDC